MKDKREASTSAKPISAARNFALYRKFSKASSRQMAFFVDGEAETEEEEREQEEETRSGSRVWLAEVEAPLLTSFMI